MNNKKNILILESLSHIAGGQRVLLNILPYIKDDFLITVLVPSAGAFSDSLKELEINVEFIDPGRYSAGKKNIFDVLKYLFLFPVNLIRSFRFIKKSDLVYVNSTRVLPVGIIGGIIFNKPVIWHNHSLISDQKTKTVLNWLTRLSSLKKIIAVSEAVANDFPNLVDKTEIIFNGVDLNEFKPKEEEIKSSLKDIIVVGDLMPTKGQDFLINSLTLLSDLEYHLKIIGSVRAGSERYELNLKKLIKELNLENRIEFLGRRSDINTLMLQADLLILPSTVSEACPLVVLEAIACGVPVIASDLGGTKEIIKDNYIGYTFKTGDKIDLADKINCFFNLNPEKISEMKKNCRREAEQKYNLENNTKRINKIINDVLR